MIDYDDNSELRRDLDALHSPSPDQRVDGSFGLSTLSDPRALPDLIDALQADPNANARSSAAWALAHYEDHRVVEPLCQALDDPAAKVREKAAFALGQILDHRAVEPLLAHLQEPDENALKSIILALGKQEDTRAVAPLLALLKQEPVYLTEYLLQALGQIAQPESKTVIATFLNHPAQNVSHAANEALQHIERREHLRTPPRHLHR